MKTIVAIPWRPFDEAREQAWNYVQKWWADLEIPLFTDTGGDDGPMNRSRARNRAAAAGGDWDVCLFGDADTIGEPDLVKRAAQLAGETGRMVWPFDRFVGLDQPSTARLYRIGGDPALVARGPRIRRLRQSPGGIVAVRRDLFETIGGWDEGFAGWGFEDVAFVCAAMALGPGLCRLDGEIFHLWHPLAPEKNRRHPDWVRNQTRARRYRSAEADADRMRDLLDELGVTTK